MKYKFLLTASTLILLLGLVILTPVEALPLVQTYIVDSNADAPDADPNDGKCETSGGHCTLYAAIEQSNLDGVSSVINFKYQFQGTLAIPGCSLPQLTEGYTTIDASARWDNAYDRPGVEISQLGCDLGMIKINSSNNTILGLFFGGSASTGVRLSGGSNNTIGGNGTHQRNVFMVGYYGVHNLSGGTNTYVLNNYFGTVDGETLPGGGMGEMGVFDQSGYNIISNNLIAGQSFAGIEIWGDYNVISDNIIGLTWNKQSALPNNYGIHLYGDNNVIGSGNVIAGNSDHGVYVYHADNNSIYQNFIGYPFSVNDLGNGGDGVHVHSSKDNRIEDGNVISDNDSDGIHVNGSSNTKIWGNGIGGNGENGIYMAASDGEVG
ncbi:MAG: NosD domain-containing protein, partial [Anaerolineales bacterium]